MDKSEQVLALILKPFNLEEKMGFKNLSVMGGFDRFIKNNLSSALEQNEITPEQFQKSQSLISIYSESSVPSRKRILHGLYNIFTNKEVVKKSQNTKEIINNKVKRDFKLSIKSDIQYAKGVGPQLSVKMKTLGIYTIEDLIYLIPRRYEDRGNLVTISQTQDATFHTVKGRVVNKKDAKIRKGLTISKIFIDDGTGFAVLSYFNQPFRNKSIKIGDFLYVSGKVDRKFNEIQFQNPDTESIGDEDGLKTQRIVPVYPSTESLSQKTIRKIISNVFEDYSHLLIDKLPEELLNKYKFLTITETLRQIHFPEDEEKRLKAVSRLIYEDFFYMQLSILSLRQNRIIQKKEHTYNLNKSLIEDFKKSLPFKLTNAQDKVIKEIMMDFASSSPMSRLVQGDVGSGKTIVAAACVYITVKSGFQGTIMAPTEILAEQHYKKFCQYLEPYGIKTALFTGSLTKKEREALREELKDGSIDVAVGTHALIQEGIEFKNLAFCVVDEQHRFGVMQRTALTQKGGNPDLLVMTATPIPRTLSLIVYGDLNISIIDELPPGRQEIKSYFRSLGKIDNVYSFVKEEIHKGRQAYIVCPLVDESDKIEAKSAIAHAEELKNGIFSELCTDVLHGKMKASEKDEIMDKFRKGKTDILISTTVIEVGVDVPNATVMVILNAERFGLAQLHQLRGRVGRGSHQSYCFFTGDIKSAESKERMETITGSTDGFVIAEKDLKLRGPGDFCGTRQSGLPDMRIADIIRDAKILEFARKDAMEFLNKNLKFAVNTPSKTEIHIN